MQMPQENNDFSVLKTSELIDGYTSSVRDILAQWQNEKSTEDQNRSLRVDGYDVDYEWDNFQQPGDGNLQPYAPTILSQFRIKLDALSKSPPFYVSITPASTLCLDGSLADILDYVNMQRYDGGWPTAADYISAIPGLPQAKITWGISGERPSKNHNAKSIDDVIRRIIDGDTVGVLGGMFNWRLNSDNWVYENMLQVALYNKINAKKNPDGLEKLVNEGWGTGGRIKVDPGAQPPDTGYTEQDWIDHKGWPN